MVDCLIRKYHVNQIWSSVKESTGKVIFQTPLHPLHRFEKKIPSTLNRLIFDEFCTFHGCHVIIRELNLKSSYNRILFGRLLDYLRAYNPLLLTVSR